MYILIEIITTIKIAFPNCNKGYKIIILIPVILLRIGASYNDSSV